MLDDHLPEQCIAFPSLSADILPSFRGWKEPSHPISGSINGVRNAATAIPQALTARRQRAFSDSSIYL